MARQQITPVRRQGKWHSQNPTIFHLRLIEKTSHVVFQSSNTVKVLASNFTSQLMSTFL